MISWSHWRCRHDLRDSGLCAFQAVRQTSDALQHKDSTKDSGRLNPVIVIEPAVRHLLRPIVADGLEGKGVPPLILVPILYPQPPNKGIPFESGLCEPMI